MRLTLLAASLAAALTGLAPGAAFAQQAREPEIAERKAPPIMKNISIPNENTNMIRR